jgi:hypothetical protein
LSRERPSIVVASASEEELMLSHPRGSVDDLDAEACYWRGKMQHRLHLDKALARLWTDLSPDLKVIEKRASIFDAIADSAFLICYEAKQYRIIRDRRRGQEEQANDRQRKKEQAFTKRCQKHHEPPLSGLKPASLARSLVLTAAIAF